MSLTAEQKAIRATGIGGSEIAAIIGASPWQSPIDVYLKKTGIVEDVDNVHTRRGTYLEQGLRDWFAAATGRRVTDAKTVRHPKYAHVLATPDGIVHVGEITRGVLEIKYPGWRTAMHWGDEGTDEIPEYYLPQVTLEMACTGLPIADVAAFIDGGLKTYVVPYSESLAGFLCEAAERFWVDHIEPRKPPPPDSTERYAKFLRDLHPKSMGVLLESTPKVDELARALREIRAVKVAADLTEIGIENQLKAYIGDADGVETTEGKISWKSNKDSTKTDWKMVASEAGAPASVIAKHTTITQGARPFIVPRTWKKDDSNE